MQYTPTAHSAPEAMSANEEIRKARILCRVAEGPSERTWQLWLKTPKTTNVLGALNHIYEDYTKMTDACLTCSPDLSAELPDGKYANMLQKNISACQTFRQRRLIMSHELQSMQDGTENCNM